jgi:outer membrane protein assembly factor BamA
VKCVTGLLVAATLVLTFAHQVQGKEPRQTEFQMVIVECGDALAPDLISRAVTRGGGVPIDRIAWARVTEDLTTLLERLGYLDASVTVDTDSRGTDTRPIVHVAEGRRYVVSRLEVAGNTTIPDRALRRLMYLREGEAFDRGLLRLTLDRFNELGCLEPLTWKDVQLTIDRDRGDVGVIIKVVEQPDYSGGHSAP